MILILDTSLKTCEIVQNHLNKSGLAFETKIKAINKSTSLFTFIENLNINKVTHIYINLEGRYEGKNRSNYAGVELILWLRLKKKFTGAIVAFGFSTFPMIQRAHVRNYFLFAPGNYYWRLGDAFDHEGIKKINKSILKEDLTNYLNFKNTINELRHQNANRWALWKLANLYSKIFEIPQFKKKFNFNQNNLNFVVGEYLYKSSVYEKNRELEEKIIELRESLKLLNKKILLIDDMADDGWFLFFEELLSCNHGELINSKVKSSNSVEEIIEKIKNLIKQHSFNLILLDIRLKNEIGDLKIEEISGYKILQFLKNNFPEIPIIIISASNKLRTIKAIQRYNVWGIWTKEGQDNSVSNVDLRYSLKQLLELTLSAKTELKNEIDRLIYGLNYRIINEVYHDEPKNLDEVLVNLSQNWSVRFSDIDCISIDTSAWLVSDQFDFDKSILLLILLVNYVQSQRENKCSKVLQVRIHNSVFFELRKHARPLYSSKINRSIELQAKADFALQIIDDQIQSGKLEIENYKIYTYDSQSYADPMIIDQLLELTMGNDNVEPKNVLLLSNDMRLLTKAKRLRPFNDKCIITKTSRQLYDDLFNIKL